MYNVYIIVYYWHPILFSTAEQTEHSMNRTARFDDLKNLESNLLSEAYLKGLHMLLVNGFIPLFALRLEKPRYMYMLAIL